LNHEIAVSDQSVYSIRSEGRSQPDISPDLVNRHTALEIIDAQIPIHPFHRDGPLDQTDMRIAPCGLRLQVTHHLVNAQIAKRLIESNSANRTYGRVAMDRPDGNRPRQVLNHQVSPHGIDNERSVRRTRKVTTSPSLEGEGLTLLLQIPVVRSSLQAQGNPSIL
jgi:hypothetical protein